MAPSGRERVEAALRLDIADRAPVSVWGHSYGREWDVDSLAEVTVTNARRLGVDFVKLQIRASCFAEAFGAGWRYSGSDEVAPVMEVAGGDTVAGWERIAEGPAVETPLSDQVLVVRRVVDALGPGVPVIQTVFSPGMVAWFLAGCDTATLIRLVRLQPEAMRRGLDAIATVLARFTSDSLGAGAAGVFYAINPLADTTVMSPAEYGTLFLPSDRVAAAATEGGWFNMLHLCGGHVDEGLVERLPMSCVNWSTHDEGNPGLAEVKERHRIAVAGGLQRYSPISVEDPGEMRKQALAALAETGGRGHLMTPGCSSSPFERVLPANVEAMADAANSA